MKKGQLTQRLVNYAIVGVIIAIMLLVVFPKAKDLFAAETEKAQCEWSIVVSGLSQLAAGGIQVIPPECNAHRFSVSVDDVKKASDKSKERIKQVQTKKYEEAIRGTPFAGSITDQLAYEHELNRIVAEEMKDCAEKTLKGKLPLFDRWWSLFTCEENGVKKPCSSADTFWSVAFIPYGLGSLAIGQKEIARPPVLCVICSRIQWDERLAKDVGKTNIDSLSAWMNFNYPKLGGDSYAEEIIPWQTEVTGLFWPRYEYSITNPLAVVFAYVPAHGLKKNIVSSFLGIEGEDASFMRLAKADNQGIFGEPPGGLGCNWILS